MEPDVPRVCLCAIVYSCIYMCECAIFCMFLRVCMFICTYYYVGNIFLCKYALRVRVLLCVRSCLHFVYSSAFFMYVWFIVFPMLVSAMVCYVCVLSCGKCGTWLKGLLPRIWDPGSNLTMADYLFIFFFRNISLCQHSEVPENHSRVWPKPYEWK